MMARLLGSTVASLYVCIRSFPSFTAAPAAFIEVAAAKYDGVVIAHGGYMVVIPILQLQLIRVLSQD